MSCMLGWTLCHLVTFGVKSATRQFLPNALPRYLPLLCQVWVHEGFKPFKRFKPLNSAMPLTLPLYTKI